MSYGIIMIIAGLLAAPKLIAGRSKAAEDFLKSIAPYQGWLGLVLFIWGVWSLISVLLNFGIWTALPILWFVTVIAIVALEIILGILLGFNLINEYILSKNAAAAEKGKMLHEKLVKKQTFFGILGIVVGIWSIIGYSILL